MKVLIIEDTDYKIQSISTLLHECVAVSDVCIARSFQSGRKKLKEILPELVLLDMTLPTSEREDGELEGRTRIYGGREIMAEIEFENLATRVIIITQFDTFGEPPQSVTLKKLLDELSREFGDMFIGGVYYSNVDLLWKDELLHLLATI